MTQCHVSGVLVSGAALACSGNSVIVRGLRGSGTNINVSISITPVCGVAAARSPAVAGNLDVLDFQQRPIRRLQYPCTAAPAQRSGPRRAGTSRASRRPATVKEERQ